MSVADLTLSGRIVSPEGVRQGTIVVKNGKIQEILEATARVEAAVKLDCDRYFILPGVIDSHVHFRDPGNTQKEDFETGTLAAAVGGVTTVMDMPNTVPWVSSEEVFSLKKAQIEHRSNVDFGLEAVVCSKNLMSVSSLRDRGAISFEAFTADVPREFLMNDDFILFKALQAVARSCGTIGVYCENQSFWEHLVPELRKSGKDDTNGFALAKPPVSEVSMISRVLSLNVSKAPVILRQISTRSSTEIARLFRSRGQPVSVEVTPHNLLLTENDAKGLKCFGKISPPLRTPRDVAGLWTAMQVGMIDLLSSDHSPHTMEEKACDSVWDCPSGFPGVETCLPLMLDQVSKGNMNFGRLVSLMSANAAEIFGLYPIKGVLRPGSQADITVVDLSDEWTIKGDRLHSKCGWTPFEGRKVRGAVKYTVLSGKIIAKDSELVMKNQGKFIPGKRSDGKNIDP